MAVGTRNPDKPASLSNSLGLPEDLALDDPSKPAVNPNIGYVGYNPNEDSEVPNLLSLSNELLVKIMLFLSEVRDRVKLRYVSRRLRSISETPSLWREFVWTDCNRREEKQLYNALKIYGTHIRRLSFPQRVVPPVTRTRNPSRCGHTTLAFVNGLEMVKMLQYCNNLTHLNLPALGHVGSSFDEQLMKGIQEIKHLQVLNVHCYHSLQPYLKLRVRLEELTIHMKWLSEKDIILFENWMLNGFIPPNLNIIVFNYSTRFIPGELRKFLLDTWPRWNSQIPAGHITCLKFHIGYTAPLNLFQNAPVFQLRYGQQVALPFLQASNIGVTDKWLLLTDHDDGSKMVYKAKCFMHLSHAMYSIPHDCGLDNQLQQDISVGNLTELDLSACSLDFKLLLVACPQLQRLNLRNNRSLRLEDLQVIATCCCNLQGLNLGGIPIPDNKFCVKVWEILSTMKLTHLAMDNSFFESDSNQCITDGMDEKQLATLFKQFTTLQALELYSTYSILTRSIYNLLAHFPSLEYCRLNDSQLSTSAQDILATCKKLKYFYCCCSVQLSQLSVQNNLQQFYISSRKTDIDDNFMDMVSTHGGLIHVVLVVNSVTRKGITALIKNSPNLLSFRLDEGTKYNENNFKSLSTSLRKKFADRQLFTSGLFGLVSLVDGHGWLQNTDLLSIWPPE